MALTRTDIGVYKSAEGHGTGSFSTSSFTPPANSLLIVTVNMMLADAGDIGEPSISGGSLTYTYQGQARYETAWALRNNLFTAPVGASPALMAITVDDNNNQSIYMYVVTVTAYTGYDTSTPIAGFVTSNTSNIGNGSETQTLAATPTADDVTLCAISYACDGDPNATLEAGWTEIYESGAGGALFSVLIRRESSTSTSVTVTDTYTGTGSFYWAAMFSFIVKAAVAATGNPYYAYAQQ